MDVSTTDVPGLNREGIIGFMRDKGSPVAESLVGSSTYDCGVKEAEEEEEGEKA